MSRYFLAGVVIGISTSGGMHSALEAMRLEKGAPPVVRRSERLEAIQISAEESAKKDQYLASDIIELTLEDLENKLLTDESLLSRKSSNGFTLLDWAVWHGQKERYMLLCEYGARPTLNTLECAQARAQIAVRWFFRSEQWYASTKEYYFYQELIPVFKHYLYNAKKP